MDVFISSTLSVGRSVASFISPYGLLNPVLSLLQPTTHSSPNDSANDISDRIKLFGQWMHFEWQGKCFNSPAMPTLIARKRARSSIFSVDLLKRGNLPGLCFRPCGVFGGGCCYMQRRQLRCPRCLGRTPLALARR